MARYRRRAVPLGIHWPSYSGRAIVMLKRGGLNIRTVANRSGCPMQAVRILRDRVRELYRDRRGVAAAEYALVAFFCGIAAVATMPPIGDAYAALMGWAIDQWSIPRSCPVDPTWSDPGRGVALVCGDVLRSDSGATLVEYALLIGLGAAVVAIAVGAVGTSLTTVFSNINASL